MYRATVTEQKNKPPASRVWTAPFKISVAVATGIAGLSLLTIGKSGWVRTGNDAAMAAPPSVRMVIPDGARPGSGAARADYGRLDARLTRLMQSKEMVGLGIAVVEHGELRFVKGYGVTTAGSDDKVTANTVFRWASLSKGMASTMVGELAAEGKLSLDDPVSRYSPSLKLPGGSERQVTIEDLLSHRLGIVKNAYDDKLEEGIDPRVIRIALGKLDRYCAPGTCFAYQNVAYDAASEVVRSVTKQSYQDAVKQRLLVPLGMTSASVTREGLMAARSWARPHVGRRTVPVEEPYYRVPAAGGMNSSILDLGTWMRAQMGEMRNVLPMRVLETIHRPRVSTASATKRGAAFRRELTDGYYALGWRDYQYAGHAIVGHRGAVRGYRSMIAFDPKTKDGVAVLWNSESNKPVGLQLEVFDMLYRRPFKDWMELEGKKAE
ncbi:serine hydrolase domain-containing protein [Sphingomonas profundi]|uniref:serine hydrolase domain-containing protein n=1 Tax=Alterirhizorhabdus profundi TaxID=2681549 RepID=UPI0012E78594|nr:serine hydrolase domain-containing protein [Sphingomonas profundi]